MAKDFEQVAKAPNEAGTKSPRPARRNGKEKLSGSAQMIERKCGQVQRAQQRRGGRDDAEILWPRTGINRMGCACSAVSGCWHRSICPWRRQNSLCRESWQGRVALSPGRRATLLVQRANSIAQGPKRPATAQLNEFLGSHSKPYPTPLLCLYPLGMLGMIQARVK